MSFLTVLKRSNTPGQQHVWVTDADQKDRGLVTKFQASSLGFVLPFFKVRLRRSFDFLFTCAQAIGRGRK